MRPDEWVMTFVTRATRGQKAVCHDTSVGEVVEDEAASAQLRFSI